MEPICRLCMEASHLNQSMTDETILTMVEDCVQIKVNPEKDLLPVEICDDCYYKIKDFSEFKENCHSIQEMLRKEIEQSRHQQAEVEVLDLLVDTISSTSQEEIIQEALLLSDINFDDLLDDVGDGNNNLDIPLFEGTIVEEQQPVECPEVAYEVTAETIVPQQQQKEQEEEVEEPVKKKPKRCYRNEYIAALVECETCGKAVHKTLIPGHMNMHKGIKPFKCPREGCRAEFHCKHKLKRHIGYKHGDGSSFLCDQCDKVLVSSLALYQHKFTAHHQREHKCSECDRRFGTAHGLERHMQTHSPNSQKFRCPQCPQTFARKTALEIHVRNHEKNRPYVCLECSCGYTHRTLLTKHIQMKHPQYSAQVVLQRIDTNELPSLANAC
ncbi:hypothetical protein pipiens_015005 [Culex pipiens pipiens]|uniref:Uncharacterized protein n=1 Tax=Culex pipiens pipiens TaxID=38569 RepID=A0ABD1CSB3_CULPP